MEKLNIEYEELISPVKELKRKFIQLYIVITGASHALDTIVKY